LITPFSDCNCKNTLPNLVEFGFASYGNEFLDFSRLLPLDSKSTLTRFDVLITDNHHAPASSGVENTKLLADFVHITDLSVIPMNATMSDALAGSSLTLKSFSTESIFPEDLHTGPLLELLASPVLGQTTSLRYNYKPGFIGFRSVAETRSMFEPLIQRICNISTLEELELAYPINEQWFPKFRACTSLRQLVWDYSNFPTEHFPFHSESEDTRLTVALCKTFDNLDRDICVDVHSRDRPLLPDLMLRAPESAEP